MIEREEVIERVRAGNRGLQVSSDTRNQHINEMEELLASFERTNDIPEARPSRAFAGLRNSAILVAAFVLGMAAAASSELVPGDLFYPAKRVAEQPVQIVDRDIVASNRVGELEELILRGADPEVVLLARTDAVGAVQDIQPAEDLTRTLSLLAWPGGLIGHGVTAGPSTSGLVISNAEWDNTAGYSASLADGHLVTVSSVGDELLIGTTGDWTVVTVAGGWRLTSADVDQSYFIERRKTDLVVTLESTEARPSSAGSVGESAAQRSITRSSDWTSSLGTGPDGGREDIPSGPLRQRGDSSSEGRGEPTPTSGLAADNGSPTSQPSRPTSSPRTTATQQGTETTQVTSPPNQTQTTVANPGTPQPTPAPPTTNPPSTTLPPSSTTTSPQVTVPQTTQQPTTVQTSPPTQQTTTTTTAPPQPIERVVYLRNGGNNTSSSRSLTMAIGSAPGGSLGNYDTDRDDEPGLMLAKDGAGLSTSDRTKYQEWVWTVGSATALDGGADLSIWLAAKDFKTDERIGLLASLDVCNPGCSRVGTGQWSGPGSSGFSRATISIGSLDVDVQAGATLRLKVVVPDSLATTDVWLAYDASSYPSRINIG